LLPNHVIYGPIRKKPPRQTQGRKSIYTQKNSINILSPKIIKNYLLFKNQTVSSISKVKTRHSASNQK